MMLLDFESITMLVSVMLLTALSIFFLVKNHVE
jgi:hypothetical protein